MPDFALRYAPHMGYLDPVPLFARSVGSSNPHAHARFAAEQGFAGLFHPGIADRAPDEVALFKRGIEEFGLSAGTVLWAPAGDALRPLWVSGRPEDRDLLLGFVDRSARFARDLGAETLAVLIMSNPDCGSADVQAANACDNLGFAGDVAKRYGLVLGIEPMVALPGMLLQSAYTTGEIIDKVDHPSVGLIFDTGHVSAMDGSVLDAHAALERMVCVYQLADMPGRTEPGSGDLDFPVFLSRLIGAGYRGLVELEHGWSEETAEGEAAGIRLLQRVDAEAVRLNAAQDRNHASDSHDIAQ